MGTPMLYSDVEVHAKIVMDPDTMIDAMHSINQLLDECDCRERHSKLDQLSLEMQRIIARLIEMRVLPQEVL